MDFPKSLIEEATNSFITLEELTVKKKLSPCRITINGKFIITNSGKSVWKRVGDAKCAIRYQLEHLADSYFNYDRKLIKEFFDYLYNKNIIQIIPCSYEECLKGS